MHRTLDIKTSLLGHIDSMRTTLTLDEDVAVALRQVCADRGIPFKTAVNETLRAGLVSDRGRAASHAPCQLQPLNGGSPRMPPGILNLQEMLDFAEGEAHR